MTPTEFRAARKDLGMTQAQLAEALGVSTKTVENIEAGRSDRPRLYSLALRALINEADGPGKG